MKQESIAVAFRIERGNERGSYISAIHRRREGEMLTLCGLTIPGVTLGSTRGLEKCDKCFKRYGFRAEMRKSPSTITSEQITEAMKEYRANGGTIGKMGTEDTAPGAGMKAMSQSASYSLGAGATLKFRKA